LYGSRARDTETIESPLIHDTIESNTHSPQPTNVHIPYFRCKLEIEIKSVIVSL
jgi:hypothetical protein